MYFSYTLQENNSDMSVYKALCTFYPYETFLNQDSINKVEKVFSTLDISKNGSDDFINTNVLKSIEKTKLDNKLKISMKSSTKISFEAPKGALKIDADIFNSEFIENDYQSQVLADMMQTHAVSDICIIGMIHHIKYCSRNYIIINNFKLPNRS